MGEHAWILLVALVIDWLVGDPSWLWQRIPHPVALFGKAINALDELLNNREYSPHKSMRMGAVTISLLIAVVLALAIGLDWLLSLHRVVGWVVEIAVVWVFLAQRSLLKHVGDVAQGMEIDGLEAGRKSVALIVGRNVNLLDESGVCRGAIESLAENFSDGVVAPAFWYLVFGLPGLLVYKMINTADSMIAHRSEKYLQFGRIAAQIDDLANWLPARISTVLIGVSAFFKAGVSASWRAISSALRDAGLHRSPNAGWPEAAMAGACNIALGGPRIYANEKVAQAYINASGKLNLKARDIRFAMEIFSSACFVLWASVALLAVSI